MGNKQYSSASKDIDRCVTMNMTFFTADILVVAAVD